jgi:hypothetical protein
MAINVDTQDLINYPGNTKRVTIDMGSLVPIGYEGDEQIVMVTSTTAYSDNTNRTAIQDLYITESKAGWLKSSGLVGNQFKLDSANNEFRLKLDNTISGSDGSGWYTVQLDHDSGNNLTGETVASDMETKIRALPADGQWSVSDDGFILAYRNCSVEFANGKFKIISGSISTYYTGTIKTAVAVVSGTGNDCTSMLGLDLYISSEDIANTSVKESLVVQDYPFGGDYTKLYIQTGTGVQTGEVMVIKDISNTEYFRVDGVLTDSVVTVTSGILTNTYTADNAKVQVLRVQDPEAQPASPFESVDAVARYGIKHTVNQIDYSS